MRDKKFTLTADHLYNTYIVGYDNIGKFIHEVSLAVDKNEILEDDHEKKSLESSKLRLLIGASIVSDIRKAVKEETGYECSAGIAHNKILAKLVCGMNKPNKQTVLPIESTPRLFENLDIHKIKSMGGKIGEEVCKTLNVKFMAELLPFPESDLQQHFGPRIGTFLYLMARGIDLEKVERKVMSKSIAVSKNFRGKSEIMNINSLKYWLKELSKELKERLDKDHEETNRLAKQMIVQYTQCVNKKDVSSSRTVQLNGKSVNSFTSDEIGDEAFKTIEKNTSQLVRVAGTCILANNFKHLGISAGKLEDASSVQSSKSVQDFLKNHSKATKSENSTSENENDVFARFEYMPTKPQIMPSKSDNIPPKTKQKRKGSVKASKSDSSVNKSLTEITNLNASEPSCSPKPLDSSLKSTIKFTAENSIRGERTLNHWVKQLFAELSGKVLNGKKNPSLIKIKWTQLKNDESKSFSDEVPMNIFSNGIKADFFANLIKDAAMQLAEDSKNFDPINFIEIEAADLSEECDVRWKLCEDEMEENEIKTEEDETIFKEEENDENLTEIMQDYTPTNDFSEESFHPETMLDVELKVDGEEEEEDDILNLERSFLGLSPARPKISDIPADTPPKSDPPNPTLISPPNNADLQAAGPSYQNSYVELQNPPNVSSMMDVLNPLEECLECGKMIRKLDMITHIDGHIAMKISQAQREEFRAEQKRKLLQKVGNDKSAKNVQKPKAVSNSSTNKLPSIERFARKDSQNDTSMDNSIFCDKCNQLIQIDSFQMHQDYHYAQKLRMEQMAIRTNSNSGTKRKRPNVSSIKKDVKSAKSLKDYFKE